MCAFLSVLWVLSISSRPSAQQVYTDRAAFESAAGPASVEGFEGTTATNTYTASSIVLPGFVVSSTPASLGVWGMPATGGHATAGSQWLVSFVSTGSASTVSFDFPQPIVAVGFDITDVENGGPLVFSYPGGSFVASASTVNGSEDFFGLVDAASPFTHFDLDIPDGGDGYGLDEITWVSSAKSVPALGGAGAGLMSVAVALLGCLAATRTPRRP